MTFEFNPRVTAMQPSATMAMSSLARELQRAGKPVISLSAGEPDFDTPAPIAEAGIEAIRRGETRYSDNAGLFELRELICEKLRMENGLTYSPDQIICSNGAKQSVALAIMALCRPGDEVLIPAPYWVSYPEMVRLAGGTPVPVTSTSDDEYRITPDGLEAALTDATRMVILNSPSNPTGSVYPREELQALVEVLHGHPDVLVLSDEIYEYVLFDAEHVSPAALEGMKERTITVNGFSKGFAMTGWRLGYLAAETPVAKACGKIQGQFTSAPSTMTQWAGVAALKMDRGPVDEMVAAFRKRRDFVLDRLLAIEGVRCPKPEGAFYVFPDVSAFIGGTSPGGRAIRDSNDLCMYLLEESHVALVPGTAFGDPNGVRLSYAASMDTLSEALDRIAGALSGLHH
jgi:aspartate aminotransferase